MVSDGKTNGREQHLGLFINPFQNNRFFSAINGPNFSRSIVLNNSKSNKRTIFNRFWDPRNIHATHEYLFDIDLMNH